MLAVWFRVIRIRFLFASVIAVSVGLALNWQQTSSIDLIDAALTFAGVIALHASVDLLNDYWDFKRGIDTATKRTKMSGGTGVLPEGLLKPSSVYRAGIAFLVLGGGIGVFFIQSNQLTAEAVLGGIVIGVLSSLVLFIASFPDYDADKSKGRKTLVIVTGKKKATGIFWGFPIISIAALILGVWLELFPFSALIALIPIPLIILAGVGLGKNYENTDLLFPSMSKTLMFSRLTGALFVIGILIGL